MELEHDFIVPTDISVAWAVLTDLERIAPCMPGAQLTEVAQTDDGEEFRGKIKIKVGPITAQYKGVASFTEKDEAAHRAAIHATGRDMKGQGNATADITANLETVENGTKVSIATNLVVTGKVAQFGRGVMADVSSKLLDQFVSCLETDLLSGESANSPEVPSAEETPTVPTTDNGPTVRKIDSAEPQALNLLDAAGSSVGKRLAPVFAFVVLIGLVLRRKLTGAKNS